MELQGELSFCAFRTYALPLLLPLIVPKTAEIIMNKFSFSSTMNPCSVTKKHNWRIL